MGLWHAYDVESTDYYEKGLDGPGDPMANLSYILVDPLESLGDRDALESVFRFLKDLGYRGVELNLTASELANVDGLLRLVEQSDFPIVSFLTGANYFGEGLCLSSPRKDVRQAAAGRLLECTATAARFDAVLVVGQMQGFRSDEPDVELAESRIQEGLRQVAEAAERHGATIVVEPVNHLQCGFHNSLAAVMRLVEDIGSRKLKPMLDSFHVNIEEQSMQESIQRVGKDLRHFHLCESTGGLLGSGHLDFRAILGDLDAVDYSGYVSVKVYREPWELASRSSMEHLQALGLIAVK